MTMRFDEAIMRAWVAGWESTAPNDDAKRECAETLSRMAPSCAAGPELLIAAREMLEWSARMGGFKAPCWDGLCSAVAQATAEEGD